jgi:hypothetical protein
VGSEKKQKLMMKGNENMNKQEAIKIFDDLKKSIDEVAEKVINALAAVSDTLPKAEYINDICSYSDIAAFARNGEIEEHFSVGDKIKVGRGEDKSIIFDVVNASSHGMCLMTHNLIAQMPFDAPHPKKVALNFRHSQWAFQKSKKFHFQHLPISLNPCGTWCQYSVQYSKWLYIFRGLFS